MKKVYIVACPFFLMLALSAAERPEAPRWFDDSDEELPAAHPPDRDEPRTPAQVTHDLYGTQSSYLDEFFEQDPVANAFDEQRKKIGMNR